MTFNGAATLLGSTTLQVNAPTTLAGAIGDNSSGYGLTLSGTGVLVLNSANTYGGGTTIHGGTLQMGTGFSSALGSSSGAVAVSGGVLDINGNAPTTGAVTLTSGSIIDSIGTGSINATGYTLQSGTASAVLSGGTASLTMNGPGAALLTAANTYGGLTTITAGTLALGPAGTIGSGGLTINPGGGVGRLGLRRGGLLLQRRRARRGPHRVAGHRHQRQPERDQCRSRPARPQQHHDHQRQPVAKLRHGQLLFGRQDRACRQRRLEPGRRRLHQRAGADRHRHLHALYGQQRARQSGKLPDHDRRPQQPAKLQLQRLGGDSRDPHRFRRAGQPAMVRRQQQRLGQCRVAKLVQPFYQRGRLFLRRRLRDFQRHARHRHERQHQRHGPTGQHNGQQHQRQLYVRWRPAPSAASHRWSRMVRAH